MIEFTIEELKQRIVERMEIVDFLDILGLGDISHLVEYFQTDIEAQYEDFRDRLSEEEESDFTAE